MYPYYQKKIICYDEEQGEILKNQLKGDVIVDKITAGGYGIFHRNNRQIRIIDNGDTISIKSDYQDDACFKIITTDKLIISMVGTTVLNEAANTITAYPNIEFSKTNNPIEVHFIDERNRDWMIYKN